MKTTSKISQFLLILSTIVLLGSCAETITQEEHRAEIANLIESDANTRDSLEKMYITTLDDIDNNLDVIRDKEGLIIMGPKSNNDLGMSKRDQILNNISMINTLLEDNKNKIATLEKSLASYKRGKKELLNSISKAKERMFQQEQDIASLKALLAENDFKIADLSKKLDEKTMLAESLTSENSTLKEQNTVLDKDVNRVYFASGTYKELKKNNIIAKQGGVLGLGRVKTLNTTLDKSKFSELSQKENTTIALSGKKPKLITKHPINSYTVNVTGDEMAQLTIKDPTSFWSYSKYLVVETH